MINSSLPPLRVATVNIPLSDKKLKTENEQSDCPRCKKKLLLVLRELIDGSLTASIGLVEASSPSRGPPLATKHQHAECVLSAFTTPTVYLEGHNTPGNKKKQA